MDAKKRADDTLEGMSVQDIIDSVNSDSYEADDSLNLDEVLAEFSGGKKRTEEPSTIFETEAFLKRAERKPEIKVVPKVKPVKTEAPKVEAPKVEAPKVEAPKAEAPKVEAPNAEAPNAEASETQQDDEKKQVKEKPRKIEKIIRPWENGIYGDTTEKIVKKPKKVRRAAKLADTLDTITRSELFEEKKATKIIETRPATEILAENRKLAKTLGLRTLALFFIALVSAYLACAEPLGWYLPEFISYSFHSFRYLFLSALFEIGAMILSIDVIANGLFRIAKLRPTEDSLIAFSSFATLIHVLTVMIAPQWHGWLPYSSISVLTLFFAVFSKWIHARAICRVCKTVRSAKRPNAVYESDNFGEHNIKKQVTDDASSFILHLNDKDASTTFQSFLAPILIVASIAFAAIASFGTHTPEHFFWALAGISCVATPLFGTLSFVFPFSVTAKNLSLVGSAVSGWFSATRLTKKSSVIVCDEDLFPKGTITLHGLKILGSYSLEQTVCYAASVICETKSGLSDVFEDLLKSRYGKLEPVKGLRYNEAGGIEAEIANDTVLVGTGSFMLRSGIRLNAGANVSNAVFIAINREVAGVFNINYKANPEVERALHMLVRKKIPVVLATRDFNLLPMMVEKKFSLKDGTLEYPETERRLDLSEDNRYITGDASAIVTRSGLYPFSAAVLAASKLRKATVRNICLTAAGAIIGVLLMFYLTFVQRPALIPPHSVFVYMLLWFIPSYLLSLRVKH